jgi:UDPglucose 6-dehydrogenase
MNQLLTAEALRLLDEVGEIDSKADVLAIITEWKEFRSPDFAAIRAALKRPVIIDGRNLYDPAVVVAEGLEYHPIGRPVARPADA